MLLLPACCGWRCLRKALAPQRAAATGIYMPVIITSTRKGTSAANCRCCCVRKSGTYEEGREYEGGGTSPLCSSSRAHCRSMWHQRLVRALHKAFSNVGLEVCGGMGGAFAAEGAAMERTRDFFFVCVDLSNPAWSWRCHRRMREQAAPRLHTEATRARGIRMHSTHAPVSASLDPAPNCWQRSTDTACTALATGRRTAW